MDPLIRALLRAEQTLSSLLDDLCAAVEHGDKDLVFLIAKKISDLSGTSPSDRKQVQHGREERH
jgi:hypothetical protein